MKVILIGYMASGKSTIGRLLAKKSDIDFIDLDEYIEKKEALSISEIFKQKGEIYFRRKESEYLKEILESKEKYILSLGGGTPCYANNIDFIIANSSVVSIYLKATITTLVHRLENEKNTRPLVSRLSKDELTEFIGKHLFERAPYYEQSTFKLSIDDKSTTQIVDEISMLLH